MEALSKLIYYVLFGINILLVLFTIVNFFSLSSDPSKKLSEALIFLVSSIAIVTGLYLAYRFGYSNESYVKGCLILLGNFISGGMIIFVGLLFFNGPVHWQ